MYLLKGTEFDRNIELWLPEVIPVVASFFFKPSGYISSSPLKKQQNKNKQTKQNRTEPNRTEPNRTEQNKTKPIQQQKNTMDSLELSKSRFLGIVEFVNTLLG